MRIGIIRLSALGDIIVAMSALPLLKEKYPQSQIDWFVDERFSQIAQNSPYIDNLYSLPIKKAFLGFQISEMKKIYKTLKSREGYDLLFDLQGLLKSALLGSVVSKKHFIGFDWHSIKEPISSLFYSQKVSIPYQENILLRNQALLGLEVAMSEKVAFGYTQEAKAKILSTLKESKKTKVLLVLEASKPQKMYPLSCYAELIELLSPQGFEFLLLSHAKRSEAEELSQRSGGELLPPLSLDEVKALIDHIDIAIGGDTGITHLAWAMKKPSITLYGNTPMQRFILKGEQNYALSGNENARYDKNDFSIAKIPPNKIAELLVRIKN